MVELIVFSYFLVVDCRLSSAFRLLILGVAYKLAQIGVAARAAFVCIIIIDLPPPPIYGVCATMTSCNNMLLLLLLLLLLLFLLDDSRSTRYLDELHDVVSPRLMAQFVDVDATLEHVTIEQVVLSFFSLAERRRNFEIEF